MVFGCGNNLVKIIVVVVNFIIAIGGAVVLGVGLWVKLDNNALSEIQDVLNKYSVGVNVGEYTNAVWGLIVLGAFMFLIGFLGCAGACCESSCLLSLYFTCILLILICQIGVIIAAFVYKGKFKTKIEEGLEELKKRDEDQLKELERDLDCKGTSGCAQKIYDSVTGQVPTVAGIAAGIIAVELIAMCFACIMCRAVRNPGRYV